MIYISLAPITDDVCHFFTSTLVLREALVYLKVIKIGLTIPGLVVSNTLFCKPPKRGEAVRHRALISYIGFRRFVLCCDLFLGDDAEGESCDQVYHHDNVLLDDPHGEHDRGASIDQAKPRLVGKGYIAGIDEADEEERQREDNGQQKASFSALDVCHVKCRKDGNGEDCRETDDKEADSDLSER
ncbi:MAG: hypothetical protein FRX48_02362 [Lasallia pustulata]|uniref:Uncharacterized protein n=1 Tax=Lasallia pustulata TaxID=136370 RepID=A0A5M8PZ83_9LECA|nr:MAG: hypothetical protein FRX48_02362 [Lasallia pustulata]